MPTIGHAIAAAQALGLERLDAQLLFLHALGMERGEPGDARAWLIAHSEDTLPAATYVSFEQLVQRRRWGEPLAYLTGHKEFFGLDLRVDARVLVPRPDTETLVSWALELLAGRITAQFQPPFLVLDLGTGSGAIALALKHARPDLEVDALDASAGALAVAQANAQRLGLEVRFSQSAWLERVERRYHCIVANPPYVAEHDSHLAALTHEPLQALVSGPDGLRDIRHITSTAMNRLYPGGWLLVEHGFDQAQRVRELFATAGYRHIESRHDLGGHERCTGGEVPGR